MQNTPQQPPQRPNQLHRQQQQQQQQQRSNQLLGAKDLVIRMLAEVFRVAQNHDGQVRWQQVSTSLVPVSLYSRTTSRWLNYLLSASSTANNTATAAVAASNTTNAMSPDSRTFLMLLQQFHQQQQLTSNQQLIVDNQNQQQSDLVVFQVVAHDYLDGHSKKVLNVKLMQPGTRLGRASDYFVYWKEQRSRDTHHQHHFQTSSNPSNASSSIAANRHLTLLEQQHQQSSSFSPNGQPLNCCRLAAENGNATTTTTTQTWGLNFASINDAKLFYDICSLNLVDLDFNSDYLQQLALIQDNLSQNNHHHLHPDPTSSTVLSNQNQQRIIRDFLHYKQQQLLHQTHQQQQQHQSAHQSNRHQSKYQFNTYQQTRQQQTTNQLITCANTRHSSGKCLTCNQLPSLTDSTNQYLISNNNNEFVPKTECFIHHQRLADEPDYTRQPTLRTRSRSTTRQPKNCTLDEFQTGKRARSFSTPASPDHRDLKCSNVNRNQQHDSSAENELEAHHPRCLSFIKQQKDQSERQSTTESDRPQKPARGVLREKIETNQGHARLDHQNSVVNSSQALHSKRTPRARYMGHITNKVPKQNSTVHEQKSCAYQCSNSNYLVENERNPQVASDWLETTVGNNNQSLTSPQVPNARLATKSNPTQRRSTGLNTKSIDHFSCISRRNARLARAQYANSKNMKEFLSLDTAGLQSTPTQIAALNEKFQQQMKEPDTTQGAKKRGAVKKPPLPTSQHESRSNQLPEYSQGQKNSLEMKNAQPNELDTNQAANETEGYNCSVRDAARPVLDAMHNASTTTDDLPMDPILRKRMFKPNSEEIISERTEPKSLSSPSANPYFDYAQREELERQVRAVSLGPEPDTSSRGLSARSEIGRRKSLERTTCVDLESNLPLEPFRASYRLSPLAQESFDSCKQGSSPSNFVPLTLEKEKYKENMRRFETKYTNSSTSTRQGRVKCPNGRHNCRKREYPFRLVPSGEQIFEACEHYGSSANLANQQRMISFKSAPDVSQFYRADNMLNAAHNDYEDYNDNSRHQHQSDARATRTTNTGLSSYAVPLCSNDGDQHGYFRKFYSCPNSLRRKQRNLHQRDKLSSGGCALSSAVVEGCQSRVCARGFDQSEDLAEANGRAHHTMAFGANMDVGCQFCSSRLCSNDTSLGICDSCAATNLTGCGNKSCAKQQYLCQHHRFACMTNVSSGHGSEYEKQTSTGTNCATLIHCRPCSSQSSRSPLRYGLYESDCDDDPDEGQLGQQKLCSRYLANREPFDRTSSRCSNPTIKPVQGYDLTMARSSCKARQRAKSQPPASENNLHLTKSMENVEKLIKEVQNELNLLRSQPLSLSGKESKEISQSLMGAGKSTNQQPTMPNVMAIRTEMLRDENSAPLRSTADNNQTKLSSSSATRRAAQFKCVGAIRKAGFLSVKKWILKRRQTIELARKQGWKRYWVCLRGTALLFHSVIDKKDYHMQDDDNKTDLVSWIRNNCGNQVQLLLNLLQSTSPDCQNLSQEAFLDSISQCYIEKEPRHLIIIEGAIAQPIPEHPKRDHVFCLSTTFGDAYLFQSACQLESENWISAVHNACAASIARDLTRDEAMKLFETRIRQLELEAEKKLFLRQRLDSRLTSMSSISHISNFNTNTVACGGESVSVEEEQSKRMTMRSLLCRLNQQLQALDTYIEQVHCEVYQLRCYLSSCGSQQLFYLNIQQQQQRRPSSTSPSFLSIDLPHPRSLLMHVCKSTKQLLIKLGIFTVSSFHAFIHARQGSADNLLTKLQQTSSQQHPEDQKSPLELRIRSYSISETLLSQSRNTALDEDTEKLIDLSNLKAVEIRVTKKIYNNLRQKDDNYNDQHVDYVDSDDRFSIHDRGDYVQLNLKIHSNTNAISIIKLALQHLTQKSSADQLDFLNYYLQICTTDSDEKRGSETVTQTSQYVAKRRETLSDWSNFEYLQLLEKIVFKVELTRKKIDEEAAPFGISIGAQLFLNQLESSLNVYCSYIEWGSVADKAGLKDEDDFLTINGVPVMDLDMMFIECIIQDESTLRLVVRSSRVEYPTDSIALDKTTWRPPRGDSGNGATDDIGQMEKGAGDSGNGNIPLVEQQGSQVISDEYISSLVCPPPPTQSSAFLRTGSTLLRQKSDLSVDRPTVYENDEAINDCPQPLTSSNTIPDIIGQQGESRVLKAKSTQDFDDLALEEQSNDFLSTKLYENNRDQYHQPSDCESLGGIELANQLLKKTEQLSLLIGKNPLENWSNNQEKENPPVTTLLFEDESIKTDLNSVERLRKSVLELLETEYAYIRHLETVNDHYMKPLEEISFLKIKDIKKLNEVVQDLIAFQKSFFEKLMSDIFERLQSSVFKPDDDFKQLDTIAQQLDSFKNVDQFKPILLSLAQTFSSEAEKFRIYGSYCVAYSRLQKLLHPKRTQRPSLSSPSIISAPNTFDSFISASEINRNTNIVGIGVGHSQTHREFLKPLGSFLNQNESSGQLKQLSDFLGHLDSSSSSVSLSLAKSSTSADQVATGETIKNCKSKTSTSSTGAQFTKSVHQQNFESYLIKPIQRIVKYPMLLGSIAYSSQVFGKDEVHRELQATVKQMETLTSHVNDTQRVHDEYGTIFDYIERQFLDQRADLLITKTNSNSSICSHQPPISLSIGQLLFFGPVDWLNVNEYTSEQLKKGLCLSQMLFVFSSCVLFICKEHVKQNHRKKLSISNSTYSSLQMSSGTNSKHFHKSSAELPTELIRYQSVIPVSEVQVRAVPTSGAKSSSSSTTTTTTTKQQDRYQWELFRCSSVNSNSNLLAKHNKRATAGKVYLLASSSNEQRNGFLRKIRFIIRESVRNMSLPVARSPSSKSLTPKKLSSPSSDANSNSSCSHSSLSPTCDRTKPCDEDVEKDDAECKFVGQVQNSYKTSIEVNH